MKLSAHSTTTACALALVKLIETIGQAYESTKRRYLLIYLPADKSDAKKAFLTGMSESATASLSLTALIEQAMGARRQCYPKDLSAPSRDISLALAELNLRLAELHRSTGRSYHVFFMPFAKDEEYHLTTNGEQTPLARVRSPVELLSLAQVQRQAS